MKGRVGILKGRVEGVTVGLVDTRDVARCGV